MHPLFCAASYFFVVQYTVDSHVFFLFSGEEAFQGSKRALQVIQPSRWRENSPEAPQTVPS